MFTCYLLTWREWLSCLCPVNTTWPRASLWKWGRGSQYSRMLSVPSLLPVTSISSKMEMALELWLCVTWTPASVLLTTSYTTNVGSCCLWFGPSRPCPCQGRWWCLCVWCWSSPSSPWQCCTNFRPRLRRRWCVVRLESSRSLCSVN